MLLFILVFSQEARFVRGRLLVGVVDWGRMVRDGRGRPARLNVEGGTPLLGLALFIVVIVVISVATLPLRPPCVDVGGAKGGKVAEIGVVEIAVVVDIDLLGDHPGWLSEGGVWGRGGVGGVEEAGDVCFAGGGRVWAGRWEELGHVAGGGGGGEPAAEGEGRGRGGGGGGRA